MDKVNRSRNGVLHKDIIEFLLEYEKTPFVFMDKYSIWAGDVGPQILDVRK